MNGPGSAGGVAASASARSSLDRADRRDAELIGAGRAARCRCARGARAELHRGGAAGRVAREAHRDAAGVGDELGLAALGERRDAERGVDEAELPVLLGDDAPGRAVTVLAEQAEPARGRRRGSVGGARA